MCQVITYYECTVTLQLKIKNLNWLVNVRTKQLRDFWLFTIQFLTLNKNIALGDIFYTHLPFWT